jgi:hypothetical protein
MRFAKYLNGRHSVPFSLPNRIRAKNERLRGFLEFEILELN